MAEGPLVHFYASRLREALVGERAAITFGVKKLAEAHGVVEAAITSVEAIGKQLRIGMEDGRTILVHLMMWGSCGIYRRGERWERPPSRARLILRAATHEVVAFSAPIVEVLTADELASHPRWGDAGPDPLRSDFVEGQVVRRARLTPNRTIGEALLDQRVMAGIGNILRIEALFAAGIDPRRSVDAMDDRELCAVTRQAALLSRRWCDDVENGIPHHVYQHRGRPCPRCGAKVISFRQDGRITFACPACQR